MLSMMMLVLLSGRADAATEAARVTLAVAPPRDSVTLLLGAPPAAMVCDEREFALVAATTILDLDWSGAKLVADSLALSPVEPNAALKLRGPVFPADLAQHARWELESPEAARVRLRIAYLVEGLSWEPEYTAVLGAGGRLSLSAVAAVRNDSGEDYERVRIDLGLSAPVTADVKNGETLRLPYVEAAGVSGELFYLYDAGANGDTEWRLRLRNTRELGLGLAPLPRGKMRLYAEGQGRHLLTAEVELPRTPLGAKAEMRLGTAREITVERRVVASKQVDAKTDVRGRLALWDQEEEIAFLVKSRKDQDILLRIAERIEGEWRMLASSHEFEKKHAERVELLVPVPAHGELKVTYKVRRRNLLP